MSKKKFRGKACPYCARPGVSTAPDHVFAREFFPKDKRGNLPQVPACDPCNREKSALEHYLTAVLPFGGRHADSRHVLSEMAAPRIAKNLKLKRGLAQGMTRRFEQRAGLLIPTTAIPFDSSKLDQLCGMMAKGLTLFHFGQIIPADCHVHAGALSPNGELAFIALLLSLGGNRVVNRLGDGAFVYEGLQSVADPELTIWRFQIYGGIRMVGDPRAPGIAASNIWVTTSKTKELGEMFGRAVKSFVAPSVAST
jgi:hypothetical protein